MMNNMEQDEAITQIRSDVTEIKTDIKWIVMSIRDNTDQHTRCRTLVDTRLTSLEQAKWKLYGAAVVLSGIATIIMKKLGI